MRLDVVEKSPQTLRLSLRTNVPLYGFFGLLFVGMGLWCIRVLAVEARIVVEQQQFTYTRTCVWILDCGSVESAVQDIRGVALVDHAVQVELPAGVRRLELPQSDGDAKAAVARDVEAALRRPGAAYRHVEGTPLAGLLLGLVCVASGLVILSAIQQVALVADRAAGTLDVTRRRLLWPVGGRSVIDLADLESVHAIPSTLRTGAHIVTSYSVGLKKRGQRVEDSARVTFLPMFTESAATELAQVIRSWTKSG